MAMMNIEYYVGDGDDEYWVDGKSTFGKVNLHQSPPDQLSHHQYNCMDKSSPSSEGVGWTWGKIFQEELVPETKQLSSLN